MRYKGITFIGGGWTNSGTGNQLGIKNSMYIDSDYWTHDGTDRITCKKAFDARIILLQGCRTTSAVQARRTVYILDGDDLADTSWGQQLFATSVRHFEVGDVVRCWEEIQANPDDTVGIVVILEEN